VTIVLPFAWLFQLSRLPLDGWCHLNAALGSASSWMEVLVWCSQFPPVTIDTIATARPADAQQTLGVVHDRVVGVDGLFHWLAFGALVCVKHKEDNPLDVDRGLTFLGNTSSCMPDADLPVPFAPWLVVAGAVSRTVWNGIRIACYVMQIESERPLLTLTPSPQPVHPWQPR
jgi:hypothetical protein